MKILITGRVGFIGSHLCEKHIKEGHTVLCLDNFTSVNLINVKHLRNYRIFKLIKGDRIGGNHNG
jgi:UDP-glucuronate decarboxylase